MEEEIKKIILSFNDQDTFLKISKDMISTVEVGKERIFISLALGFPAKSLHKFICDYISDNAKQKGILSKIDIEITTNILEHHTSSTSPLLQDVKNVIAIASAKGGVGKSTTTVNLALALEKEGANVGILDADIYGPSIPSMLGIVGKPDSKDGKKMFPMEAHNLQANSIGFLVPNDQALIWRGPMVTQALDQLLNKTEWVNLDYLLIDMPPGTGDIHLSLAQKVPLTGAVIVTTPQEIAVQDARKGIQMFQKVSVPILGVIENMGIYICPSCGNEESIFGSGGGEELCKKYSVNFFGSLPLDKSIRANADLGKPIVLSNPENPITKTYTSMAQFLGFEIAKTKRSFAGKFPEIVVKR